MKLLKQKGLKETTYHHLIISLLQSLLLGFALLGVGKARTMRRNNRMENQASDNQRTNEPSGQNQNQFEPNENSNGYVNERRARFVRISRNYFRSYYSPDTPFIGRKAFYPNPNENNGNEHGTASNTGGGTESEPNDSTAKPSMNTNQQHRRNNFNRHNQGYRENGQRRQDRHHRGMDPIMENSPVIGKKQYKNNYQYDSPDSPQTPKAWRSPDSPPSPISPISPSSPDSPETAYYYTRRHHRDYDF